MALAISGPKKEKVAAQLLSVMYDASLDHFVQNDWPMFQWPVEYSSMDWQRNAPFGSVQGQQMYRIYGDARMPMRRYPDLFFDGAGFGKRRDQVYRDGRFDGNEGMLRHVPGVAMADAARAGGLLKQKIPAML